MREAGRIVALLLEEMGRLMKEGVMTKEIDEFAEEFMVRTGARPAFKGYHGYPKSICVSINEEVVHGIPGSRKLKNGDIVSVDVGVYAHNFVGDGARTYPVGGVSPLKERLMKVTEEALYKGIEQGVTGNRLGDISHAIQSHVEGNGFSVVRDLVGHGIGRQMHEEPQVPNFGSPGKGILLEPGMVLAIEPMVNAGDYRVKILEDGWTVVAEDRSPSAHFEHTVAILEDGPRILTLP